MFLFNVPQTIGDPLTEVAFCLRFTVYDTVYAIVGTN